MISIAENSAGINKKAIKNSKKLGKKYFKNRNNKHSSLRTSCPIQKRAEAIYINY